MDVLARVRGVCGELVLRSDGRHFEVIANGTFLMDTRAGDSERLLVTAAADRVREGARMLIGGLGVGFSLRAAVDHPRVASVVVVEREPAVVAWNSGPLSAVHGAADTAPGVTVECTDLLVYLDSCAPFDAICLDIDNGPQWTVEDGNSVLYTESGLDLVRSRLTPGGVLTVWSAAAAPEFAALLATRFTAVDVLTVPVRRGEPDVVYRATR